MFGLCRAACAVRGRSFAAHYWDGGGLPRAWSPDRQLLGLPAYRQLDWYSCGFVAALTVVHHFRPHVDPDSVLAAVRPTSAGGCGVRRLVRALDRFGIAVADRDDLSLPELFRHANAGRSSSRCGRPCWAAITGLWSAASTGPAAASTRSTTAWWPPGGVSAGTSSWRSAARPGPA